MKIAFLLSQFPALSETFILNQITGLIDLGHEVSLFAGINPNQEKVHDDIANYQLMERVCYQPPLPKNRMVRQMRALGVIMSLIFICPVKVTQLLRRAFAQPEMPLLRRLYWFRPFAKKEFDILHCHFGPMGNIGADLKQIGIKAKLITTFYGYDVHRHPQTHGKHIYDRLFSSVNRLLVLSAPMKEQLVALGCSPNLMTIHHLGVKTQAFFNLNQAENISEPINILTVARLTEKKGLAVSIQAFANVIKKTANRSITYSIVGDGPLRSELESAIASSGVKDQITLTGYKNQDEIKGYYRQAQLFLLASHRASDGDEEGTPTVIAEAMASALPVIATRHSGIPEMVEDGVSGFLVPEKDVDALTEKLTYLINHPRIWPEMGRRGREFVEKHFDSEKLNHRLVEIYQDLL